MEFIMDKLPKVNIAVIGVICSSLGGMVWYASEQASIIANLEETVAVLDAQSNTTDKVNMIRDIERNQEHIQELMDILSDVYEEMDDADSELWSEIDTIHEDTGSMAGHMMEIIKLQSRIAILEKTVEFTRKDGM
jgi:predicted RNase H-like nuclease (RuvC/YqgF family)|tara:strand:- start:5 stop:409 length:405 start_codon:yes stop_codon:yes gene_type:complete